MSDQGDGGRMDDETRRARVTDIEAWRTAIQYAPEPELGMVDWPRVLGLVLDELGDTRARLAAVEALAVEWRNVTLAGFYPEASAHANAVENCGDALIDLLSEPAAALGATDQAGGQR